MRGEELGDVLGKLCWVRNPGKSGRLRGARIEEGWGEQGARRRARGGAGRTFLEPAKTRSSVGTCLRGRTAMGGRVAVRPSPTDLPKCLRARGVHSVLDERGRYHATTMLATMLQPCYYHATTMPLPCYLLPCYYHARRQPLGGHAALHKAGGPAVSLASQGCPL